MPARGRVQVAHAGREGIEVGAAARRRRPATSGCTWYCTFGQRWRSDERVKAAQLRRRHAHRPAAQQQVFQADHRLAPQRVRHRVERLHAVDAEHGADLQVVLQVLADAGVVQPRRDACGLQHLHRADARQLQDLRRADGASAQHHLAPAVQRLRRAAAAGHDLDAMGVQGRVHPVAQQQPRGLQPGAHLRLGRFMAGRRKALVAFQRTPRRWLTSK
jgi:hypothetical protein